MKLIFRCKFCGLKHTYVTILKVAAPHEKFNKDTSAKKLLLWVFFQERPPTGLIINSKGTSSSSSIPYLSQRSSNRECWKLLESSQQSSEDKDVPLGKPKVSESSRSSTLVSSSSTYYILKGSKWVPQSTPFLRCLPKEGEATFWKKYVIG